MRTPLAWARVIRSWYALSSVEADAPPDRSFTPSNTMAYLTPSWPSTSRLKRDCAVVALLPLRFVAPMPWFIIDTFMVAAFICRRAARMSVQRSLPSVSVPRPSVIESPMATMPRADASAMTSITEMKNQRAALVADVMLAAFTVVLLLWKYDVVRDPECWVSVLGTLPSARVMVTLPSAGSAKSIGSDQTSLPAAIVTVSIPENIRALSVAVSMVLSTSGVALHSAM